MVLLNRVLLSVQSLSMPPLCEQHRYPPDACQRMDDLMDQSLMHQMEHYQANIHCVKEIKLRFDMDSALSPEVLLFLLFGDSQAKTRSFFTHRLCESICELQSILWDLVWCPIAACSKMGPHKYSSFWIRKPAGLCISSNSDHRQ